MLAKYVADILSVAGHGLDSSYNGIAAITKEVEPMVFEFEPPDKALKSVVLARDSSDQLLAWGIEFNDLRRIFLEVQDLDTIKYKIPAKRGQVSVSGSVQKSIQQLRVIYKNKVGDQVYTDWIADSDAYFEGSFRRKSVRIDNVDTDTEATEYGTLLLDESKKAKRSQSISISEGEIFTNDMVPVRIEDIQAGSLVMIEESRSGEADSATDARNNWTTEMIVAVEIDYGNKKAKLIPASSESDFAHYMRELERLSRA